MIAFGASTPFGAGTCRREASGPPKGDGGAAGVAETGTQVTFRSVQEDSRCPAQVNCIWAGRVVVEVDAQAPGLDPETFTLSTCCSDSDRHHEYAGQDIELMDVSPPPPPPGGGIAQEDYRAQILVASL